MDSYKMSKESIFDSTKKPGTAKIKIAERKKDGYGGYNGLEVSYCAIGICDSPKKPCTHLFDKCPYEINEIWSQPRKNAKEYERYRTEFCKQMEIKYLNSHWNEQIEKIVHGELTIEEPEYAEVVSDLANKLNSIAVSKGKEYSSLIRSVYYEQQKRKRAEEAQKKIDIKKDSWVYKIGDYLYINAEDLPDIVDEHGNNVWYNKTRSHGMILIDKFNKKVFERIKFKFLECDFKQLCKDLDNVCGLATMLMLSDDENEDKEK